MPTLLIQHVERRKFRVPSGHRKWSSLQQSEMQYDTGGCKECSLLSSHRREILFYQQPKLLFFFKNKTINSFQQGSWYLLYLFFSFVVPEFFFTLSPMAIFKKVLSNDPKTNYTAYGTIQNACQNIVYFEYKICGDFFEQIICWWRQVENIYIYFASMMTPLGNPVTFFHICIYTSTYKKTFTTEEAMLEKLRQQSKWPRDLNPALFIIVHQL